MQLQKPSVWIDGKQEQQIADEFVNAAGPAECASFASANMNFTLQPAQPHQLDVCRHRSEENIVVAAPLRQR